ncbi:hypothetical protein ABW21_db0206642 [Orbilia brochopaga]|nr:hypothetical protein ABW21_db0206642 [Drechslerella brochopaga]
MYSTRAAVVRWQERTAASSYDTSGRSIALEPIHLKNEATEAQVDVTSESPQVSIFWETLQCLLAITIEIIAIICILVFSFVDITLSTGVLPNDSRALYVCGTGVLVVIITGYAIRQIRLQWIFYIEARRLRKADVAQNVNSRKIEALLGVGSYKDYYHYWGITATLLFASLSTPAIITALTPSLGLASFTTTLQITPDALNCTTLSHKRIENSISWKLEDGTFINFSPERNSCLTDSSLSIVGTTLSAHLETDSYGYMVANSGVARSSIGVPYNAQSQPGAFDKIFWDTGMLPQNRNSLQESSQCLPVFAQNPAKCYRAGQVTVGTNSLTVHLDNKCNVSTPIFGVDLQQDGASASGFCTENHTVGSITYMIGSVNSHAGQLASAILDFPAAHSRSYAIACDIDIPSAVRYRETTISRNYKPPYESFVNRDNLKANMAAEFTISSLNQETASCNQGSFSLLQGQQNQKADLLTPGALAVSAATAAPLFLQNRYNDGWWETLSGAVMGRRSASFIFENSKNALEDVLGVVTAVSFGQYLGSVSPQGSDQYTPIFVNREGSARILEYRIGPRSKWVVVFIAPEIWIVIVLVILLTKRLRL